MSDIDTIRNNPNFRLVFVCGARDFQAIDKIRQTEKVIDKSKISILTDLIESESQKKLVTNDDNIFHLFNIDKLLFKKQSRLGDIWRNLIKTIFIPIQVKKLKAFYKANPTAVYHAITTYYMFLCYKAHVPFVGTPQGSEVLVRPDKSKLYKKMLSKALKAAKLVAVDSLRMKNKIKAIANVEAVILKDGFNTDQIFETKSKQDKSVKVLSFRGVTPLYQIEEIIDARNNSKSKLPITLLYPFNEAGYKTLIEEKLESLDQDLGRLGKSQLYETMSNTMLAVSIPQSDSSPRSVYECILSGACVAITYFEYYDELPECMKNRIILVDIKKSSWFDHAVEFAEKKSKTPYTPSKEALEMCDEKRTIKKVIETLYINS